MLKTIGNIIGTTLGIFVAVFVLIIGLVIFGFFLKIMWNFFMLGWSIL